MLDLRGELDVQTTQQTMLEAREQQHQQQLQEQAAKTKEKAAELEAVSKELQVGGAVTGHLLSALPDLHFVTVAAVWLPGAWLDRLSPSTDSHLHMHVCLQAAQDKLDASEERARELYDCNKRLEDHIHDLESRKRAPLYQKRQVLVR
jgi:hypothetical protein